MKYVSIIGLIIIAVVGAVVYYSGTPATEMENRDVTQGMPVPGTDTEDTVVNDTTQSGTPTSADGAPPGSIHNLPVPEAVAAVRKLAATVAGVPESQVVILTAYEKEWSDGCLGLGGPAESCIQMITPGYEVTVSAGGKETVYRTNDSGTSIRKEK